MELPPAQPSPAVCGSMSIPFVVSHLERPKERGGKGGRMGEKKKKVSEAAQPIIGWLDMQMEVGGRGLE